MAVFTYRRAGAAVAPDTSTVEVLAFLAATNRKIRLVELSASGLNTATAANEFQFAPGNAGTGALTSIASFPNDPASSAASGFTSGTTFATAIPTVNAQAGIGFGVNANGASYRWLAKTNFEIMAAQAVSGYQSLNWKCVSGTSTICGHVIVEEL
jgi:hypothetical protein